MDIKCILKLGHEYKRIGKIIPIKYSSDFEIWNLNGHYAMGECIVCKHLSLRECHGTFEYYERDMITKREYWLKYKTGKLKLEESK